MKIRIYIKDFDEELISYDEIIEVKFSLRTEMIGKYGYTHPNKNLWYPPNRILSVREIKDI